MSKKLIFFNVSNLTFNLNLTLSRGQVTTANGGNFNRGGATVSWTNNFLKSICVDLIFSLFFSRDMTAISVLWTVLSFILFLTSTLAFFSPFWHEHVPDPMSTNNSEAFVAFGVLRFCLQEQFVTLQEINEWTGSKYCSFYKGIFPGIPSVFWKVAGSMYAFALLSLLVALLLAHVSCCRKFVCGRSITAIAAIIQSIAGNISLLIFCLICPLSF